MAVLIPVNGVETTAFSASYQRNVLEERVLILYPRVLPSGVPAYSSSASRALLSPKLDLKCSRWPRAVATTQRKTSGIRMMKFQRQNGGGPLGDIFVRVPDSSCCESFVFTLKGSDLFRKFEALRARAWILRGTRLPDSIVNKVSALRTCKANWMLSVFLPHPRSQNSHALQVPLQ